MSGMTAWQYTGATLYFLGPRGEGEEHDNEVTTKVTYY